MLWFRFKDTQICIHVRNKFSSLRSLVPVGYFPQEHLQWWELTVKHLQYWEPHICPFVSKAKKQYRRGGSKNGRAGGRGGERQEEGLWTQHSHRTYEHTRKTGLISMSQNLAASICQAPGWKVYDAMPSSSYDFLIWTNMRKMERN